MASILQVSPPKSCIHFSSPHNFHMPHPTYTQIWSPEYFITIRCWWPCGIRCRSCLLGSRVRIPRKAWMFCLVFIVCCVGSGLWTSRSLVEGGIQCVRACNCVSFITFKTRHPRRQLGCCAIGEQYLIRNTNHRTPQFEVFSNILLLPSVRPSCLPQHPILEWPHLCSSLNVRDHVQNPWHPTGTNIVFLIF
jgi:hypothetical protein